MSTLKRLSIFMLACLLAACSAGAPNFPSVLPASATATLTVPPPSPLPPTLTPLPMAFTVNGEGLTLDEFTAELARYQKAQKALGKTVTDEQARQAVQDELIAQILLAQGAAEAGYSLDEPGLRARREALSAKIGPDKFNAWLQEQGYSQAGFDLALARSAAAAWMRDKIMASVPATAEQVHVRQILLYNEDVAKSYYDQLQAGADFDGLAARVDPVTRGDIGWFPRGYLTEKAVEDAAFALDTGAYSAIIPGEAGFHILKLLEKQAGRELSPDALLALQNHALNDWLANRRQQSKIVLTP